MAGKQGRKYIDSVEVSEDDWAAAMGEQAIADTDMDQEVDLSEINTDNIIVTLTAVLGRTKMTIGEIQQLSRGSVIALDGLAGEPMEVLCNGTLVARGEVVVVNEKFGIRITEIV